jgi:hypothetical protein
MINGIRRRLGNASAADLDLGLKPEIDVNAEPSRERKVLQAAATASGHYIPDDPGTPDYYKNLVRTAIENGGRHGYHSISIPWLRMILAGLESKQIEPEMMWYGIEAGEIRREQTPAVPSYENLFQSGRDA